MIIKSGEPKPGDSGWSELRVFHRESHEQLATLRGTAVRELQVRFHVTHIPYCEGLVESEDPRISDAFDRGNTLEVFHIEPDGTETMKIRARLDFADVRLGSEAGDSEALISFQARSAMSPSMDSPALQNGSGRLRDLVSTLASRAPGVVVETEVDELEFCVDAASEFAAILLAGLSFDGCVDVDRSGTIIFRDVAVERERFKAGPDHVLTDADIRGARVKKGIPVQPSGPASKRNRG